MPPAAPLIRPAASRLYRSAAFAAGRSGGRSVTQFRRWFDSGRGLRAETSPTHGARQQAMAWPPQRPRTAVAQGLWTRGAFVFSSRLRRAQGQRDPLPPEVSLLFSLVWVVSARLAILGRARADQRSRITSSYFSSRVRSEKRFCGAWVSPADTVIRLQRSIL